MKDVRNTSKLENTDKRETTDKREYVDKKENLTNKKGYKVAVLLLVGLVIWYLPYTDQISDQGWHLLAIVATTILGFMLRPWPTGAIALGAVAVAVGTKTITMKEALLGYSDMNVWLIVSAILFSRGLINSGLGRRIAYTLISYFGTSSLRLAYALACTDLILSPATPSNTARGGGIIYPIVQNISLAFDSRPGETARRLGAYLITTAHTVNTCTVTVFLTACSGNLLITSLGLRLFGYEVTWWQWFVVGSLPGLLSLVFLPWFIYRIYPPTITHTPEAPQLAKQQLAELGPITSLEKKVALIFTGCIILWSTTTLTGLHPTAIAMMGVLACIVTGCLTWQMVLEETTGWDILIWMGTLVGLAGLLGQMGVVKVFASFVSSMLVGLSWPMAALCISLVFVYSQYFFASGTARITALFSALAAILLSLGAPVFYVIMMFGLMNSPGCTLTHYSSGVTPIFFGSGYVPQGTWWKVGLAISIVSYIIHFGVGSLWMWALGMI